MNLLFGKSGVSLLDRIKQSVGETRAEVAARVLLSTFLAIAAMAPCMSAQKSYDPGASDTKIKIGNIMSYTGWAESYGAVGRAEAAYFQMINDRGGVNGRKITFVSVDNASRAGTAAELARN